MFATSIITLPSSAKNGGPLKALPYQDSLLSVEHHDLTPEENLLVSTSETNLSKLTSDLTRTIFVEQMAIKPSISENILGIYKTNSETKTYDSFFDEELSHASVAKSINQTHGDRLKWATDSKEWYAYDHLSGYWKFCDDVALGKIFLEEIELLQNRVCKIPNLKIDIKVEWLSKLQRASSSGFTKGVISLLASVSDANFKFNQLDSNHFLVGLGDGQCLDLKTVNVRPIKAADYLTKSIGTSYDTNAECPLWEKSVLEWCCSDHEIALFLQALVGYSLSGLMNDHSLYFLYGNGKNGKSVFINILSALFGQNGLSIDPSSLMDLKRSSGQASGDIARLAGKRFISSNELPNNGMFNEELLKRITAGDEVVSRKLYSHDFQFSPTGKLFISGNNLPIIRGRDDGIWRRISLIPFNAKIAFPDGFLDQKLRKELPGILNWAIKGWQNFVKDGYKLTKPLSIENASSDYRKEMDLLTRWKDDCLQVVGDGKLSLSDIFGSYKNWCVRESILPMSSSSFNRETKNMFDKKREKSGYFVYGVSLNRGEVIKFN